MITPLARESPSRSSKASSPKLEKRVPQIACAFKAPKKAKNCSGILGRKVKKTSPGANPRPARALANRFDSVSRSPKV